MVNTVQIYQTAGSNEYLRLIRSAFSSDRLAVLDLLMSKTLYENLMDDYSIAGVQSHIIERPPFRTEIPWDLNKVAKAVCKGTIVKRQDVQRSRWINHFLTCCNDLIRRRTLLLDVQEGYDGQYRFIFDASIARVIIPNSANPSTLTVPTEMYQFHRGYGQKECSAFLANRLMLVDRKMNGCIRPDSMHLSWPELSHITMLPGPEAWRRDGNSKQRNYTCRWFEKAVKKPLEAYGLFSVRMEHQKFWVYKTDKPTNVVGFKKS